VLVDKDGTQRLYFVVETKSSLFTDDLRNKESAKIECGKAHFQGAGGRRQSGTDQGWGVNALDFGTKLSASDNLDQVPRDSKRPIRTIGPTWEKRIKGHSGVTENSRYVRVSLWRFTHQSRN
jgi:hypothetical protein